MKNWRLKQLALSLSIVLSLFVSSMAACACSHHQSKAETHTPSCHQSSQENQQTVAGDETKPSVQIGIACNCFIKTAAPFAASKFENFKTQKTQAVLIALPKAEKLDLISQSASAKFHRTYYFYNSNYLRKNTPPRAPPA